jgi:hypothetical protein
VRRQSIHLHDLLDRSVYLPLRLYTVSALPDVKFMVQALHVLQACG